MPIRAVASYMPCLAALRGRPYGPAIQKRIDAALDPKAVEFILEPDPEARLRALETAEVYICRNEAPPEGLFQRAKKLRLIQAGTPWGERIGMERAAEHGVAVALYPRPTSQAVADGAMLLLLILARNLPEGDRRIRGSWPGPFSPTRADGSAYNWTQVQGVQGLTGVRMGILGMGEIARFVAQRARGFGMDVRYWNRTPLPKPIERKLGCKPMEREKLLKAAEVLYVGVGMRPDTRHYVGAKELAALPEGAIVLNLGRGPLVDQEALLAALDSGRLGGAGLDVFSPEPLPPDHPLLRHPRVAATPHIGGGDDDNLVRELEGFLANAHRIAAGKRPIGIANGVKWS
ncbi:MAG: NAD(P)-dependent oxidoreductase [Nitrospinota bacterium]